MQGKAYLLSRSQLSTIIRIVLANMNERVLLEIADGDTALSACIQLSFLLAN